MIYHKVFCRLGLCGGSCAHSGACAILSCISIAFAIFLCLAISLDEYPLMQAHRSSRVALLGDEEFLGYLLH